MIKLKLKHVGFFKELAHGYPNGPSLVELVGKAKYQDNIRDSISAYLNQGHLLIGCPGVTHDFFDEGTVKKPLNVHIFTDGQWAWPADFGHYVKHHNVPIPQEFFSTMQSNSWRIPTSVNLHDIEF